MTNKITHDNENAGRDAIFDLLRLLAVFKPMQGIKWCFRGQADISWKLIPKVGRSQQYRNKNFGLGILNFWEQYAVAHTDLPDSPWERMAVAQHHGLATRLLDWSYNPLVALFFACNEAPEKTGALYVYAANRFIDPHKTRFDLPPDEVGLYMPRAINPRIHNQAGVFTYHSDPTIALVAEPMEGSADHENLSQMSIKAEWKMVALQVLDTFGINDAFLFPGLDGLSRYANWTYHI